MYLHRLDIQNIKGIPDLKFEFLRPQGEYAGWSVILGDNGSGKTTILRAIAATIVGPEFVRTLTPTFKGWITAQRDFGSTELTILTNPDYDQWPDLIGNTTLEIKHFLAFGLQFKRNNGGEPSIKGLVGKVNGPSEEAFNHLLPGAEIALIENSVWNHENPGWFCLGYGPFRRNSGGTTEAQKYASTTSAEPYLTLFREDAAVSSVTDWLMKLSHKEKENDLESAQLLQQCIQMANHAYMPNGFVLKEVNSDGVWLVDAKGTRVRFEDMGEGYKSALALLLDIIHHMAKRFKTSQIFLEMNGEMVCNIPGIILIDEVDSHLHPEWQREIGFWLKKYFPRIQFIVTTHSPLICQAADENGIFILPEPGSNEMPRPLTEQEYQTVIAGKPDEILRSAAFRLANTRSPKAVHARSRIATLNAKKRAGAQLDAKEVEEWNSLQFYLLEP